MELSDQYVYGEERCSSEYSKTVAHPPLRQDTMHYSPTDVHCYGLSWWFHFSTKGSGHRQWLNYGLSCSRKLQMPNTPRRPADLSPELDAQRGYRPTSALQEAWVLLNGWEECLRFPCRRGRQKKNRKLSWIVAIPYLPNSLHKTIPCYSIRLEFSFNVLDPSLHSWPGATWQLCWSCYWWN